MRGDAQGWAVGMGRKPCRPIAKGSRKRGKEKMTGEGVRRFSLNLNVDTVESVAALAQKENTTFAEAMRLLIEWGLETLER